MDSAEVLVLEAELRWCKENPDPQLSNQYYSGFIGGLQQAINLIKKTQQVIDFYEEDLP